MSSGRELKEYLSIPYAKPPVGLLRFKSPQPPEPWTQILNNSVPSCKCWSSHATNSWDVEDTGMSEDCLYLSIWSPPPPRGSPEELRPVMVLLTSGKEEGALSGLEVAAEGEVVFVKVESRHGALGFLAGEDSPVTTNIGLLDQTLALKWVQANIDLFGGDSARVTILGNESKLVIKSRLRSRLSRLRGWGGCGLPSPPLALLVPAVPQHDPPVRQPLRHHRHPAGGHQEDGGAEPAGGVRPAQ